MHDMETSPESGQDFGGQGIDLGQNRDVERDDAAATAAEKAYFATRGASGLPSAHEDAHEEKQEAEPEAEPRSKTVPHAALHAEREEHKKTRAELREMRAKALEWQRDLAALQQSRLAPPAKALGEAAPPPDPREDFLGFARWQGQEINRLSQELAQRQRMAEEESRAQAAEEALSQEWSGAVEAARHDCPDIDEALDFLQEARLSQLGVLSAADGRFADKAFCEKQIYAELRDIIIGAFSQGVNPAKAVYDMAKAYGYGRSATARMDKISAAAAAARSLTAGSGGQAGDPFLLETVANLPEAEFTKWYEKNRDSFRRMFGG